MNFGMNNMSKSRKTLILSVLSAAVMGLLILLVFKVSIPNPNMILIIALVLFTGLGGWIPGAVSAVLILLYSMFFFSTDHTFFQYSDENAVKITIILIGDLTCYAVVSFLKHNRDKNHQELIESNRQLLNMNKALEEKAAADARYAELSRSVTELLNHIPAMTFSKDISTGRYLACNQLFADYAHKATPEGVAGLTDHEIFDDKTADHFVEDDRTALSMNEPFVFFEDVPDAVGNPRHFQTTKQKFYDGEGRLCTLGLCVDVTELINMKKETLEIREAYVKSQNESQIYLNIAQSLSADYTYVYYVDTETDEYIEYRAFDKNAELALVTKSEDFFNASYRDAQEVIYEEDRSEFLSKFTKENLLRTLDGQNAFVLIYRLMIDGKPQYVSMKVNRMKEDMRHIVIGVKNIDASMKERQAANRIKQEQATYTRVNALSAEFIAIYSIDPETCQYEQYSSNLMYDGLGIRTSGENFFEESRMNAQKVIYHEDLEKFNAMFTRANVLREIHEKGIFSIRYRIVIERRPIHVRLKAAMIEEGGEKRLIVGIINITEQVKQDQEYEYHISVARTLANRDELTGVKNKHAYVELEMELNRQIEGREPVEFAVIMFDVNELKNVNDTKGHQAGDEYLKRACSIICETFKHSPVFRIGGDEFAVISRGSDYAEAENLIAQIESNNHRNRTSGEVVIACGMARYSGESNVAQVFERADRLMYENKRRMKL